MEHFEAIQSGENYLYYDKIESCEIPFRIFLRMGLAKSN